VRLEVCCIRPTAVLAARLRQAARELGVRLDAVPPPPAAFVSPTQPTVVALAGDRILASAVGDLPLRELRAILGAALRANYPDTRLSVRSAKVSSVAGMGPAHDPRRQRP
jgi:hypothetical protein